MIFFMSIDFYRELRHPNNITLMAYSINENQLHIVTNYVEGPTLDKLFYKLPMRYNIIAVATIMP